MYVLYIHLILSGWAWLIAGQLLSLHHIKLSLDPIRPYVRFVTAIIRHDVKFVAEQIRH